MNAHVDVLRTVLCGFLPLSYKPSKFSSRHWMFLHLMQNRASPPSNMSGSLRLSPNDLVFQHVELKGSLYKSLNFFNSKFITSNLYLTHLDSANFLFINTFPVHQCYSHWENATFSKISFRYYRFFLMCIMQLQF